jgi:hypothetical protein
VAIVAGLARGELEPSLCWRAVWATVAGVVGVAGAVNERSGAKHLVAGGSTGPGCAAMTLGCDVGPLDRSSETLPQRSSHMIRKDLNDPLGLLDRLDLNEFSLTKVSALERVSEIEL